MTRLFNILKIIFSPTLYTEAVRYLVYYFYEHVVPISKINRGKSVDIHPTASLRFGENITLGDNALIEANCCVWASKGSKIHIGENSAVAYGTMVISSNHGFLKRESYTKQEILEKDIVIEDDVFIGANCVIMYGVTIGKGSVIGAGTVVSKNIPAYSVAVGKSRNLTILDRR